MGYANKQSAGLNVSIGTQPVGTGATVTVAFSLPGFTESFEYDPFAFVVDTTEEGAIEAVVHEDFEAANAAQEKLANTVWVAPVVAVLTLGVVAAIAGVFVMHRRSRENHNILVQCSGEFTES